MSSLPMIAAIVAEGMMRHHEEPTYEEHQSDTDPLYNLRTHLTDAILAADFLRRADADFDDAARARVHKHLQEAHEALRDDVDTLNWSLDDQKE